MSLPQVSHLQYAVLSCLGSSEMSGRELRAALKASGAGKAGAAFYQLMARIEGANWVAGRYHESELHGESVRERLYKITEAGAEERAVANKFYARNRWTDFGGSPQPEPGYA